MFDAVKRSFSNASKKRKLEIISNYARDPRVRFSVVSHSIDSTEEAASMIASENKGVLSQ
jgi:PAB1-binding protein PBP1